MGAAALATFQATRLVCRAFQRLVYSAFRLVVCSAFRPVVCWASWRVGGHLSLSPLQLREADTLSRRALGRLGAGECAALYRSRYRTADQAIEEMIIGPAGPLLPLVDHAAAGLGAYAKLGGQVIGQEPMRVGRL